MPSNLGRVGRGRALFPGKVSEEVGLCRRPRAGSRAEPRLLASRAAQGGAQPAWPGGTAHSAPGSGGARQRGSRAMGRLLALSLLGIALALLGERLLTLR